MMSTMKANERKQKGKQSIFFFLTALNFLTRKEDVIGRGRSQISLISFSFAQRNLLFKKVKQNNSLEAPGQCDDDADQPNQSLFATCTLILTGNPGNLPFKNPNLFQEERKELIAIGDLTRVGFSSGEHNPRRGVGDTNRLMSEMKAPPPLYKHRSLPTPDSYRDEAWLKRKGDNVNRRIRRSKSVTDEDVDELKACIELGFAFDSPELDDKLTDTLPALGLYYAVHKNYNFSLTKSASTSSSTSSMVSELDPSSPFGSPHHTLLTPGDSPQLVKTRLRQWAQVVACSVRQIC